MEYNKYLDPIIVPTSEPIVKLTGILLGVVMGFFMPIMYMLYFILGLVLADLFLGWRTYVKSIPDKPEFSDRNLVVSNLLRLRYATSTIHSKGIGRTIDKLMIYLVVMAVCNGFDKTYEIENKHLSLSWYIGGIIIAREIKSILEKADIILDAGIFKGAYSIIRNKQKQKEDNG